MGIAKARCAGLNVHIPGVEGRAIFTHDIATRALNMLLCRLGVARVAARAAGLVQQRQIHITVDDHTSLLFGVVQLAPGLDDPGFFVIAFHQRFGSEQGDIACFAVAGQALARHA